MVSKRERTEQIKTLELELLYAKAQIRPNPLRIRELESQLAKLKVEEDS